MADRAENRPEIEPYFWDISQLKWPVNGKTKPDLILFDPLYFNKGVCSWLLVEFCKSQEQI